MDRDSFSKDLARLLREMEKDSEEQLPPPAPADAEKNAQQQRMVSREELLHESYQRLCYDDPSPVSIAGCQALCAALIDSENRNYALSKRLVKGIHQCIQRKSIIIHAPTPSEQQQQPNNDNCNDPEEESPSSSLLLLSSSDWKDKDDAMSLRAAYAQLAWTIHGRIPLECCKATTFEEVEAYLGSYYWVEETTTTTTTLESRAPADDPTTMFPRNNIVDAPVVDANANTRLDAQHHENGNGYYHTVGNNDEAHSNDNGVQQDDASIITEVFAAESDDSDFEFESEYRPEATVAATWLFQVEQSFDPSFLSKSPETLTWKQVAMSVSNLLETFAYSHISGIITSGKHWKQQQQQLFEHAMQLILALLVPSSSQNCPVLTCDAFPPHHWQRLGSRVLQILRELVFHQSLLGPTKKETANETLDIHQRTALVQEYAKLIRILLQVDRAESSSSSLSSTIASATWLGFSFLSALCWDVLEYIASSSSLQLVEVYNTRNRMHPHHWKQSLLSIVQDLVLNSCDDLAELLETSRKKEKEDIRAIQWSCLSIFQILTIDVTLISSKSEKYPISNANAQLLLNSGLFRQWLLYWSQASKDDEASRAAMLMNIYDLCAANPDLLGKYAWRFPGASEIITNFHCIIDSDRSGSRSLVAMFLWSLFGIYQINSQKEIPMVPPIKWNKTSVDSSSQTSLKVTVEYCQETAWQIFQSMCKSVLKILVDWMVRKENSLGLGTSRLELAQRIENLNNFEKLAARLVTPFTHTLFTEKMVTNGDPRTTILQELHPIQKTLSEWPSSQRSDSQKQQQTDIEDDRIKESSKDHSGKQTSWPQEVEDSINLLRKSIKIILSALDTSATSTNQNQFSSKAD